MLRRMLRGGASGWTSDIIPHAIYGLVTVLTYEAYAED